jgi:hypothetical protein
MQLQECGKYEILCNDLIRGVANEGSVIEETLWLQMSIVILHGESHKIYGWLCNRRIYSFMTDWLISQIYGLYHKPLSDIKNPCLISQTFDWYAKPIWYPKPLSDIPNLRLISQTPDWYIKPPTDIPNLWLISQTSDWYHKTGRYIKPLTDVPNLWLVSQPSVGLLL